METIRQKHAVQKEDRRATEAQAMAARYRDVFGTESGKIVLEHLKAVVSYGKPSHTEVAGSFCPIRAALKDGEKAVVFRILDQIDKGTKNPEPPKSHE